MQMIGRYVVSLTAAALIGGILLSLFPEGAMRTLVRLVCGIVLTVTALSPFTDIRIPVFQDNMSEYMDAGMDAANYGEAMAEKEQLELIKLGLEAYILDKAAAQDCEVVADVQLNSEGTPVSVWLTGTTSEEQRKWLEAVITNDLGIPKEDQQWSGQIRRIP